MQQTIYLFFKGQCEEAMSFYADLFGGKILGIFRNSDAAPEMRMPGSDDLVMNMMVRFDGFAMMASDAPGEMYNKPQGFDIHMEAGSAEEARRWFDALAEGGSARMKLDETFWAERFGSLVDRWGVPWMISYTGSKGQQPQG